MTSGDTSRKQKVIQSQSKPFAVVPKSERRSPLRQLSPRVCDHPTAYRIEPEERWSGIPHPLFVCTECGKRSDYPEDLSG